MRKRDHMKALGGSVKEMNREERLGAVVIVMT